MRSVGEPAGAISEIDQFLKSSIAAGEFAGAVYLVAEGAQIRALAAVGDAVRVPQRLAANVETIYDLASLTKPLITGMLLAQFIDRGQLELAQPVSRFLPQFDTPEKRAITIGQLATHSAGLVNWRPFYAMAGSAEETLDIIAREPLAYESGARVIYSDLGYITLGFLLAKIGGKPLDELARQMILEPLGLTRACYNPPLAWREQIAASETGNQYERKLAGSAAVNYGGWRNEVIWGQVHDQNAYFLGGVAGHAGLFGCAREIYLLARQFLPGSRLVTAATQALFQKNFTPGCEEARALGWLLAEVGITAAGEALSRESFGHVGFTGTSLWLDPEYGRCYILLANRTHPQYQDFNMNERRRHFHALAQAVFK